MKKVGVFLTKCEHIYIGGYDKNLSLVFATLLSLTHMQPAKKKNKFIKSHYDEILKNIFITKMIK